MTALSSTRLHKSSRNPPALGISIESGEGGPLGRLNGAVAAVVSVGGNPEPRTRALTAVRAGRKENRITDRPRR